MAEDPSGFFGRWSRRKTEVLQGKPLTESVPAVKTAEPAAVPAPAPAAPAQAAKALAEAPLPEQALSLDDVRQLTQSSDFTPFMARQVGPEVRNAALKKLFADPHYNVMDGLDIYIDDYSKSDPIPAAMLRQMTGAKLLKIFDDEEDAPPLDDAQASTEAAPAPAASPNNPTPETMAQSAAALAPTRPGAPNPETFSQPEPFEGPGASQHDHADPHLRLQPDHAPSAAGAGRGTS